MGAARRAAIRRLWVRVLGILRCGREASRLLPGPATTWPGPWHDQRRLPRLDSANHDDDQRGQPRHPGPAQGQAEHSNRAFAGQVVQRSDDQGDAPEDDRRDQGQEEHRPTDSGYSCHSSCSVHGPPFPGPGAADRPPRPGAGTYVTFCQLERMTSASPWKREAGPINPGGSAGL